MEEKNIRDNPRFKNLREEANQFRVLKMVWPFLKPFAKLIGVDTKDIDEEFIKAKDLVNQMDEMIAIPDKFNDLFCDQGWIIFESMDLTAATNAIQIAEKEGIQKADEFLADYFSPDWVEERKYWLKYIKGFEPRFPLALKALEDYKAGRYYSSVLVTLSLIDGWVNELNIMGFQRQGFFSEKSQLVAWDSITAHPKGLMKLKEVFGKLRQRTRAEEITIPYRHGIIHGMDLGYDNKFVAAKCWAALFALRDWAIKVANNELVPPKLPPKIEKSLWESIEEFNKTREKFEKEKLWQPRKVLIGETIPSKGQQEEYPSNSPERKVVEFHNYWLKNNYGFMATCYSPMMGMEPSTIRRSFEDKKLIDYELIEIADITSTVTDIKIKERISQKTGEDILLLEFRLVASLPNGDLAIIQDDNQSWGISTWSQIQ